MSLRFFRFSIPLAAPLTLADGREQTERSGFLLREGAEWAEASPLPGFSQEGEAELLEDFQRVLADEAPVTPSVRFAMMCLRELPDEGVDCNVSALLAGVSEGILKRAAELPKKNCPAAKLKVGSREVEDDAELVRAVAERLDGKVALRLDANRQWRAKQVMAFHDMVKDIEIDYIEEPVDTDFELADVRLKTKWRTAYDETLQKRGGVVTILEVATSDMLIDKPTLTGGLQFNDLPRPKKVTYSASFESGVGLYRIAQLASQGDHPAGLDTYRWLAGDVLKRPLRFPKWHLKLKRMPPVDLSVLEEFVP